MINWTTQRDEFWNGLFTSNYFLNSDKKKELEICIDGAPVADYAEKCVTSFNHLSEPIIMEICKGVIKSSGQHGPKWRLKSLRWKRNPLSVLNHCYFSAVYVNEPANENKICYIVEGEGEWDDVIGFVVNDDRLVYVGTDYLNEENWG